MRILSSITASVLASSAALYPISSQASSICTFNGTSEKCSVTKNSNTYTVRWNSDGKVVHYTLVNGSVIIVEDNGRKSGGNASIKNGYMSVYSTNGNTTSIPITTASQPVPSQKGAAGAASINGNGNVIIQQIYQSQ